MTEKERRRTLRYICEMLEGMDARKLRLVYTFVLHLADRPQGAPERPQEDTGAARA